MMNIKTKFLVTAVVSSIVGTGMGILLGSRTKNDEIASLNGSDHRLKLNQATSIRLRELMDERRLDSKALSRKSGVSTTAINSILDCYQEGSLTTTILRLCQGLEIEISDFFDSPLFLNLRI